jgi:hypothetical protein
MGLGEIIHAIKSRFALVILIMIHTSPFPMHTHGLPHMHTSHPNLSTYTPCKHVPVCCHAAHVLRMLSSSPSLLAPLRETPHSLAIQLAPNSHSTWGTPLSFYLGIYQLCLKGLYFLKPNRL